MNSVYRCGLGLAWAAGLAASVCAQTSDYTVTAGFLYNAHSSVVVPADSLLLLVDTGSGSLGSLAAGGSVVDGGMLNGSTLVLQQFAVGDGLQTPGTVNSPNIAFDYSSGIQAGDHLAIVWLPNLTLGSTTLTAGDNYGSFTGVAGTDGSAWVVPTEGSPTVTLDFETDGLSGNSNVHPESTGQANSLVLDAVPEPASYALIAGIAALGLAGWRRRSALSPTRKV